MSEYIIAWLAGANVVMGLGSPDGIGIFALYLGMALSLITIHEWRREMRG